jgi:hypothetical protein
VPYNRAETKQIKSAMLCPFSAKGGCVSFEPYCIIGYVYRILHLLQVYPYCIIKDIVPCTPSLFCPYPVAILDYCLRDPWHFSVSSILLHLTGYYYCDWYGVGVLTSMILSYRLVTHFAPYFQHPCLTWLNNKKLKKIEKNWKPIATNGEIRINNYEK